jgi:hypothetical protein
VAAVSVFFYSVLSAAVYALLGLALCFLAISRLYPAIDYVVVSAACAGAVVGAVAGATQLITSAVRRGPTRRDNSDPAA